MPLESTATAVLALHYQNEVLHANGKIRVGFAGQDAARALTIASAKTLLSKAREQRMPIVHVRIAYRADYADVIQNCDIFRNVVRIRAMPEGSWGSRFFEGLAPDHTSATEFIVTHTRVNAFYGSQLDQVLRVLGAKRLIVAGIATHSVVESTVRHAADVGFEVIVARDACAAADRTIHESSLNSMRLIAQVCNVEQAFQ